MPRPKKSSKPVVETKKTIESSKCYSLTKDEKEILLAELIGAESTVKQALKSIGILSPISADTQEWIASTVSKCSRCGVWNVLSDLDYEEHCEPCTAELTDEDVKSYNAYDNDSYADYYYDGGY